MEYCIVIGGILLAIVFLGDSNNAYPPQDTRGNLMKLSFSSRSGRAVWVPQSRKEVK